MNDKTHIRRIIKTQAILWHCAHYSQIFLLRVRIPIVFGLQNMCGYTLTENVYVLSML